MKPMKLSLMVIFVLAVCAPASTSSAYVLASGAFGSPDPTTGSMVMGWFDIGKNGTENVLPIIVNMSTQDLGTAPANPYRVHIIIWDVNSNHVWDKNIQLSPWDVWTDASIRDIIENTIGDGMASAQRAQITEKVTIEGVEVERYRGYWTATVVLSPVGSSKPFELNYPHAYLNVLGGWVYVVDLPLGVTDGYAMVSVESSILAANTMETAFMLSFSADFWNRPWWWIGTTYGIGDLTGNTIGAYFSALWDCAQDEVFFAPSPFQDTIFVEVGNVYERFDATACLNASLLSTGKAVTSDDTWLARNPSCDQLPYDGGEAFIDEDRGGMMLFGRFFRNPTGGAISNFNNRLVLWMDTNSTGRSVILVVCDEEEGCHSFPLIVPDELNIHRLDEVVGDVLAGFVYFHTRQIENPGAKQRMISYWRSVADSGVAPADSDLYNCVVNGILNFLPVNVNCNDAGGQNSVPFGNALQILGWTTNEGVGTAAETWGAIFPMVRKCILGDPTTLEVLDSVYDADIDQLFYFLRHIPDVIVISDRNMKENFGNVESGDVLARVADLPISTWNYKQDSTGYRHMGPMAQDFHAAFGLGDDRTIHAVDAGGVAFAAIQELNRKLDAQTARIEELEKTNRELQEKLELLKK
ncbi:MAG: tail fiber domain-containing protein [Deltaproteobacteria bacterium]|nr:tail fiber domain-containing protein [Deltaproteobacteria bacterium]